MRSSCGTLQIIIKPLNLREELQLDSILTKLNEMKKTISTLVFLVFIISIFAQETKQFKKWNLGISFTPNISFLYNPTNYTEYLGVSDPSGAAIRDKPLLELTNFGLRIRYSINKDSEIETGLIYSIKDYKTPLYNGGIEPEWRASGLTPFFDIPLLYKRNLLDIQSSKLKLTCGIVTSIPFFDWSKVLWGIFLYEYVSNGNGTVVITKNNDAYPICMNVSVGLKLSTNDNKRLFFELGPVFQSAIMPFSKKLDGNRIILDDDNHYLLVSNPDKGFAPYFIGFDFILHFNSYKKNKSAKE